MIEYDFFLQFLYQKSTLSLVTQHIYMDWVTKCCCYHHVYHILDVSLQDIERYRLHLLQDKGFSPSSDVIVFNAFKHTYHELLQQVDPDAAMLYADLFKDVPRQPNHLPRYVDYNTVQLFLAALPNTVAGNIIRMIYHTSKSFNTVVKDETFQWKCSKRYASQICAKAARQVDIPCGFGLSGVRGASIIHRIQRRQDDIELKQILDESGLSPSQFELYRRVADTL